MARTFKGNFVIIRVADPISIRQDGDTYITDKAAEKNKWLPKALITQSNDL